jgi:hypothetical protein
MIALRGENGLVLLVGLDTLFVGEAFDTAVRDRLDPAVCDAVEEIVFVATHTHNAPALDPTKPRLGEIDTHYFKAAVEKVAEGLARLVRSHGTVARVDRYRSSCSLNALRRKRGILLQTRKPYIHITTNMVPSGGEVPRELQILVGCDENGTALWALWQWCCHATSAPCSLSVSPDFPGHVRAMLRRRFKNKTLPVIFLPGFCGDIRPDPSVFPIGIRSYLSTPLQRPFALATSKNYQRLCDELAKAVDSALESRVTSEKLSPATVAKSSIPLAHLIEGGSSANIKHEINVVTINAGSLGFLLVGAEVCSPYIDQCFKFIPSTWFVSGYCGHVFGYLPDDAQIEEGGYESRGFFEWFGLDGHFKSKIEGRILKAMRDSVSRSGVHVVAEDRSSQDRKVWC